MLRRLTETLEELKTLREQMIHQTERQMVQQERSPRKRQGRRSPQAHKPVFEVVV